MNVTKLSAQTIQLALPAYQSMANIFAWRPTVYVATPTGDLRTLLADYITDLGSPLPILTTGSATNGVTMRISPISIDAGNIYPGDRLVLELWAGGTVPMGSTVAIYPMWNGLNEIADGQTGGTTTPAGGLAAWIDVPQDAWHGEEGEIPSKFFVVWRATHTAGFQTETKSSRVADGRPSPNLISSLLTPEEFDANPPGNATAIAVNSPARTTDFNLWYRGRCVSGAMAVREVRAQPVKLTMAGNVASSAVSLFFRPILYVSTPGDQIRAMLYDALTNLGLALTSQANYNVREFIINIPRVDCEPGDRMVLEIWAGGTSSMATAYITNIVVGGGAVEAAGGTVAANPRVVVEFQQDLFKEPPVAAVTKVWDGSDWVEATAKGWSSSAWKPLKVYDQQWRTVGN
jgi:hypothetical protein